MTTKNSKGIMLVVVILSFFIVALSGYLIYDKVLPDNETDNSDKSDILNYAITPKEIEVELKAGDNRDDLTQTRSIKIVLPVIKHASNSEIEKLSNQYIDKYITMAKNCKNDNYCMGGGIIKNIGYNVVIVKNLISVNIFTKTDDITDANYGYYGIEHSIIFDSSGKLYDNDELAEFYGTTVNEINKFLLEKATEEVKELPNYTKYSVVNENSIAVHTYLGGPNDSTVLVKIENGKLSSKEN